MLNKPGSWGGDLVAYIQSNSAAWGAAVAGEKCNGKTICFVYVIVSMGPWLFLEQGLLQEKTDHNSPRLRKIMRSS
jgi:hypothetical protein